MTLHLSLPEILLYLLYMIVYKLVSHTTHQSETEVVYLDLHMYEPYPYKNEGGSGNNAILELCCWNLIERINKLLPDPFPHLKCVGSGYRLDLLFPRRRVPMLNLL